ncbi:hypothetical protein V6N13_058510 [Hibiscus sabdariffa]
MIKHGSNVNTEEKRIRLWTNTYITELEKTEFTKIRNGSVSGLDRNNELNELHFLRPHQIHRRQVIYEFLHRFPSSLPFSTIKRKQMRFGSEFLDLNTAFWG